MSQLSVAVSQFEQKANNKFMCKLGKGVAEMLDALQTIYGDNALKKKQLCVTGTTTSKVGKNSWKTSLTVGDFELL